MDRLAFMDNFAWQEECDWSPVRKLDNNLDEIESDRIARIDALQDDFYAR